MLQLFSKKGEYSFYQIYEIIKIKQMYTNSHLI